MHSNKLKGGLGESIAILVVRFDQGGSSHCTGAFRNRDSNANNFKQFVYEYENENEQGHNLRR